jgi:hypothetical protein
MMSPAPSYKEDSSKMPAKSLRAKTNKPKQQRLAKSLPTTAAAQEVAGRVVKKRVHPNISCDNRKKIKEAAHENIPIESSAKKKQHEPGLE